MGDMGDYYRDVKEWNRQEKAERLAEAERLVGSQFTKLSPYHWRTTIAGYIFDYWPTTGTYRYDLTKRKQRAEPAVVLDMLRKLRYQNERTSRDTPTGRHSSPVDPYKLTAECEHEWADGAEGAFAGLSEHCSKCGYER